jgi:hypothetical protein
MPPKRKFEVGLYESIETPIQEAIDVVEAKMSTCSMIIYKSPLASTPLKSTPLPFSPPQPQINHVIKAKT